MDPVVTVDSRWSWLAVVVAACVSGVANAEDEVHVVVTGGCPDPAIAAAALRGEGVTIADGEEPAWAVRIDSTSAGARLRVARVGRGVVADRVIASADCPALAEAFALLVKLAVEAGPPPPRPAPAAADDAAPAPPEPEVREVAPPGMAAAGVVVRAPRVPRSAGFSLAAGVGSTFARGPDARARFAQVDAAVLVRRRMVVQLDLRRDRASTVYTEQARVARGETSLAARLGAELRLRRLWLRPTAGVGAAISRVRVDDALGSPRVSRLHPILDASVAAGVHVGGGLSGRVELGGVLYPIVDEYVHGDMGVVGRSPRAAVSIGFALQYDLRR